MRVLREDAALHQTLAHRARVAGAGLRSIPIHSPRPRTSATCGTAGVSDLAGEPRTELGRGPLVRAVAQHVDDLDPDRAGERVAAERRAVLAGLEHAEHVAVRHHGRQRHDAAAERLAEDVHVGHDVLVLDGERRAGAAEPRLDLVGDQQHAALGAELAAPPAGIRRAG